LAKEGKEGQEGQQAQRDALVGTAAVHGMGPPKEKTDGGLGCSQQAEALARTYASKLPINHSVTEVAISTKRTEI
jgi:hypothetical protein